MPDIKMPALGTCLFFIFSLLYAAFKRSNTALLKTFILTAIFFLGIWSIQARLHPNFSENHITRFLDSEKITAAGRVVSYAKHYPQKTKVVVACSRIDSLLYSGPVEGRINLTIYGTEPCRLGYGDTVLFKSKIKAPRNFRNPGGFDYERFLALKGIFGSAWTTNRDIKIISGEIESGFLSKTAKHIETFRNRFAFFVTEHVGNNTESAVILSLLAGKKEMLLPATRDLFSAAGISHLLAISGLHLSIIYLIFFTIIYRVLALLPNLLVSGYSKKAACLAAVVPLTGYAVFTGFSPSTQRALIMVAVVAFSFTAEKEKDLLSAVSVAGVLILLADAASLFAVSFQMSFAAVISIFIGIFIVRRLDITPENPIAAKLFMMTTVTFFAGLGTAPLTAYYFNTVSLAGLLSNLIFIPLVGCVVLPMGIVSMFCFSLFPGLSAIILNACCFFIKFTLAACQIISFIPFSFFKVSTPGILDVLLFYLLLVGVVYIFKNKRTSAVIVVLIFLVKSSVVLIEKYDEVEKKERLEITVLDVGQGSSSMLRTPGGKHILVDGGGFSAWSTFDTGRFIVAPFLLKNGITRLDYVILSHPENDHLNGLLYIFKNFDIGVFIKNKDKCDNKSYLELMEICRKKKIRIWHPSEQRHDLLLKKIRLEFLDTAGQSGNDNLNDNSIVFKLIYHDFSMLFPGDILKQREGRISLLDADELGSDILLSPHHGSRTSSSKLFLEKLAPQSVIISCGWKNRYGFPHDTVLDRYCDIKAKIFRTDRDGAVFIFSNGWNYTVETARGR